MMQFKQAILQINGQTHALQPNRSNTFETLFVDFKQLEAENGTRYSIFLHPKQALTLERLEIQFDCPLPPDAHFLANGYQSWSETQALKVTERTPRLHPLARPYMGLYGDAHIQGIPRGRGHLHAWTYTHITQDSAQKPAMLIGSLSERTGFTLLLYDYKKGILTIRKDLDTLDLRHSFPALDCWLGMGELSKLYDTYCKVSEIKPPTAEPAVGWTSWYHYFNQISEEILRTNADSFQQLVAENRASDNISVECPAYFQIDDGWQKSVGDWLSVQAAFPKGMRSMALEIKEKGLSPGLWLAPFVASAQSDLVRKNPEWLLKDAKGKPIRAGWNPLWGGWFYALDFYHEGVREYLSGVFHTVLDKWGFDLVKLDFLFAVALVPPPGKTRGSVMWEAMEFLRNLVGKRRILACGVPLGACFGQVDYCRIGGDVHLSWQHTGMRLMGHRERADTLASLHSTLSRWPLNGRFFHNDPDVLMLRKEKQRLNPEQQHTLLTINVLLGNLLFTSDEVSTYSDVQKAEYEEALSLRGSTIWAVENKGKDVWVIRFSQGGLDWRAVCNLSAQKTIYEWGKGARLALYPFETMILKS